MCRTIQSLIQTIICALQMVTRIFMTVLLMLENMIRMLLQSVYNLISTILQIISLIPICCIFMVTAKMRCLLCGGGGGGCGGGGSGGGFISCFISALFLIILFKGLRSYGLADKFMARLGYTRASKYDGRIFTGPPSANYPVSMAGSTGKPEGRMGQGQSADEDIKNYIFDDLETTTTVTSSLMEYPYAATEYSKIGNLSTISYYLF